VQALDNDAELSLPTARAQRFEPPLGLGRLREQPVCPLRYPDGYVGWLVTSHALAKTVLTDSRFGVRPFRPALGDPATNGALAEAIEEAPETSGNLLLIDPPQHTRIRRLQTGYFSVRRVSEHRAALERIVSEYLDAMEKAGPPVDFVEMFAHPVPALVLCELLGVSPSERHEFERLTVESLDEHASAEAQVATLHAFNDYCRQAIEQKRAQPADDLLSDLIRREETSEDELTGIMAFLFVAGHETTATMLGLGTFALLSERGRWEALHTDPSAIDSAVEELLRYLSIIPVATTRTASEGVDLDGVAIRAGESVTVSLAAANRDPGKFDRPNELELTRDASGHLAFGQGRHMCLGQHLARLELLVALAALVQRLPRLRLAVPIEEVRFHDDEHSPYGIRELPVTW